MAVKKQGILKKVINRVKDVVSPPIFDWSQLGQSYQGKTDFKQQAINDSNFTPEGEKEFRDAKFKAIEINTNDANKVGAPGGDYRPDYNPVVLDKKTVLGNIIKKFKESPPRFAPADTMRLAVRTGSNPLEYQPDASFRDLAEGDKNAAVLKNYAKTPEQIKAEKEWNEKWESDTMRHEFSHKKMFNNPALMHNFVKNLEQSFTPIDASNIVNGALSKIPSLSENVKDRLIMESGMGSYNSFGYGAKRIKGSEYGEYTEPKEIPRDQSISLSKIYENLPSPEMKQSFIQELYARGGAVFGAEGNSVPRSLKKYYPQFK